MYFQATSHGGSKYFHSETLEVDISPLSLSLCYTCVYLFVCVTFFSTCKENKGIYSAMRLDKVFNISSYLNTTVVSKLKSQ